MDQETFETHKAKAWQGSPATRERRTATYRIAGWLSWLLFNTILPVRYHGVERAQLDAPYILISNHNSMIDPLIAGWNCRRYQIRFLGKKELIKNPILKALFGNMLMIAVDRHNMDMSAVRACLKTIKEGHPLGVFPEGTRHKQGVMQDLESGIAMIALRGNVPLLPVYITAKPRFLRPIDCYFADPISVDEMAKDGIGKENCERLLDVIRHTYEGMVAEHEKAARKGS